MAENARRISHKYYQGGDKILVKEDLAYKDWYFRSRLFQVASVRNNSILRHQKGTISDVINIQTSPRITN